MISWLRFWVMCTVKMMLPVPGTRCSMQKSLLQASYEVVMTLVCIS